MFGILNYGTYIPPRRLKLAEIAGVWKKDEREIVGSLGISEKSVAGIDEDAVTLAIEAAQAVLSLTKIKAKAIGALLVGSESHPYAVNPTSTIVGELLDFGHEYLAADLEFACKAGSSAIQAILGLVIAGKINYGLAIGADVAQSKPHDILEYTSAAASVAYLLGKTQTEKQLVAGILDFVSFSSDTPDFWRRDGIRYPSHAGRFTGEPAYFAHVTGATKLLLEKTKLTPDKINYCVFHMPNGKFPRQVAKRLGFTQEQLAPSLVVDQIGNPYSASSLLGLAATLDIARPKQKILMVSYGSGAGSDGFVWEVGERKQKPAVQAQIENKKYINYVEYLKQTHKI